MDNRSSNQNKEKLSAPTVGASSLLTVFAVLCLTVFALLALSTVSADMRLSDASAQAVSDYYAADCAAQEIFARIKMGEDPANLPLDEVSKNSGGARYTYTVEISDNRELQVEIAEQQGHYSVLRWQAVPNQPWENDESIEVWDGFPQ